ncbi:MAG: hypothetical protein HRT89_16385 [Lentisphaeria bacterium]|nr:hypothetical protein [Lentisphaeria bacterium]NQZ69638.1 hypothetical protein [Lentisphaeria bacterium]
MKPEKITKLKGILCKSFDGRFFFRVRDANGSFRDYTIAHSDLTIEIQDEEAFIYEKNGEYYIDHSPATLGLSESDDD